MVHQNSRINILLSSPAFLPTRGGAELRFLRYLPGLQKRNLACRILTGTPKLKKIMPDDRSSNWFSTRVGDVLPLEYHGEVPVHRIRLPNKMTETRSAIFYNYVLDVCRDPQSRPDIVQMVANLPVNCVPLLQKMRGLRIPVLYAYTLPPRRPSNPIKSFLKNFKLRRNLNSIDCIIANSRTNRDHLVRLGVKSRIEVILNGVDLQNFSPASDEKEKTSLRCKLSCPPTAKIFLSVGAVHPRKGTDLLLEAWPRIATKIPDSHLYLLGMRHDLNNPELGEFRYSVEKLIDSSGVADRIHFLGYVPNVAEYLRAADLLLFPSRTEGMPNAMIEAMACGLPVVTCPFIGISKDLGSPDVHYVLVDHDPEAIARAAVNVLRDIPLRRRLSQNARSWVVETLEFERTLDRYADLYHEIALTAKERQ
jgi:glycosyltransferase involved in cell wall biosynthesis